MALTRRGLSRHALALAALGGLGGARPARAATQLLNVSYDPTREFYRTINAAFLKTPEAGAGLQIRNSHGGSGSQARAVIDGLEADVVTLALAYDIDAIARAGRLAANWQSRLPDNASPYTSTIVFLVRRGNPKKIRDWGDLVEPGVQVITPNPKTSGGARWNVLAAHAWAMQQGGEPAAMAYLRRLFANVPVLDAGARGATISFSRRKLGDVLVGWENEAFLARQEAPGEGFEIVTPSLSILAEPPVAVVDQVVDRHGTRAVAEAYLRFLYTPPAQEIAAQNFYRPRLEAVAARYVERFAKTKLVTIDDPFGGWARAQAKFFDNGGVFDQIYKPGG